MKKLLLCGSLFLATGAFSQVLTEDFEGLSGGALPSGWTSVSSAGTATASNWMSGTAATAGAGGFWPVPAHGSFALINDDVCNCNLSAAYLVTPVMDFTGLSSVVIQYNFVDDQSYGGNPHQVQVTTDGGTTWNTVFTLPAGSESINWQENLVSLGAATDNASAVQVRFKYDDGGIWATGLAIDDVVVKEPLQNDAKLAAVSLARYASAGANTTLSVNVTNIGGNAITSLTIDWNDGTSHAQTITTNIAPGATLTIAHPTAVTYATAVEESLTVSITMVNGVADADPTNNNGSAIHNTVSQLADKRVVIEEGTGTWCGWCPRGTVAMDYMTATYPDFIGIAVHNGDPMTVAEYDNGADISGFPGGNFERIIMGGGVSQASFEAYYNANINDIVPAAVDVAVSGVGANITLDASATFYTPFAAGDFRLAVVMVEDQVKGTGAAWNQVNYYAGGANGPMGGYELLPNPVPAANMLYDHVGRALLGGYNGQAGSVPAVIADGTVGSYSFTYTVPAGSSRDHMHAVALLLNNTTGEIVNAKSISIADGSSASLEESTIANMIVYPNPTSDMINVQFDGKGGEYTVSTTDMAGVTVATLSMENAVGSQTVALPVSGLAAGVYLITVSHNGVSTTQRVTVQ